MLKIFYLPLFTLILLTPSSHAENISRLSCGFGAENPSNPHYKSVLVEFDADSLDSEGNGVGKVLLWRPGARALETFASNAKITVQYGVEDQTWLITRLTANCGRSGEMTILNSVTQNGNQTTEGGTLNSKLFDRDFGLSAPVQIKCLTMSHIDQKPAVSGSN